MEYHLFNFIFMKHKLIIVTILLLFFNTGFSEISSSYVSSNIHSNKQVLIRKIIQNSIDLYPGNCPCPYSRDSRGYKCGKRSAYSRAGGYKVLCYSSDVTQIMIEKHSEAIHLLSRSAKNRSQRHIASE